MIEIVLRAGTPFLNVGLLQELSAITGLIARTANQDISNFIEPNANQDLGAHLFRLQKLMLSLFPRFILSEGTFKQIQKVDAQHQHAFATTHNTDAMQKSEHIRYFLQISCNLALYARNAIANHSADHRATGVIFSPNINENLRRYFATGQSQSVLCVEFLTHKYMYSGFAEMKFAVGPWKRHRAWELLCHS